MYCSVEFRTKITGFSLTQIFPYDWHPAAHAKGLSDDTRMMGQNWFRLYSLVFTIFRVRATSAASEPLAQ